MSIYAIMVHAYHTISANYIGLVGVAGYMYYRWWYHTGTEVEDCNG